TVGLLGEPSRKFDYYVLYPKAEPSQPLSPPHKTPPSPHKPPPPPKLSPYNQKALSILHQDLSVFPITKDPSCSYSQEYRQEFPALTAFEHLDSRTKHDWKIKNPTTIGLTGHANAISPVEATLNWQSENVVAQNKVLVKILSQQGVSFDPQPLPRSYTHTISPSLNIWESEQRRLKPSTRKEPTFSQESQSIADVVALTKTPYVLPIQKIQQSISPEAFMSIIYSEFIGSPWEHTAHAREEFLKMKCCSFQKKDLEKHYDRMSHRFYYLNRVDDVNLKQVFLNSFPESLGNEAYQALEARNVTIAQTTLGELY
ncbi:hypothetical protein Tco_0754966, partial [Tanacetum coccineum]